MAQEWLSTHGQIVWHELLTPDAAAASAFYEALFGWKTTPEPMSDHAYEMIRDAQGKEIGGLLPMLGPKFDGVPPCWMTYVAVDDIQATVNQVQHLGGQVCVPPTELPIGFFAVITDPHGAALSLWQCKKNTDNAAK